MLCERQKDDMLHGPNFMVHMVLEGEGSTGRAESKVPAADVASSDSDVTSTGDHSIVPLRSGASRAYTVIAIEMLLLPDFLYIGM